MKLLILNGPNLNLLGIREPGIYGNETYEGLCALIQKHCDEKDIEVSFFQSNHEGDLVDAIQRAFFEHVDGIVFNPGAYTHTSIALLDAIKATKMKVVEVHISDTSVREEFRHISYIRPACIATIQGKGLQGYIEAVDLLEQNA